MRIWSEIQNDLFVLFMEKDDEVFNCAINSIENIEYAEDISKTLNQMIKSLSIKTFPLLPVKIQIEREINELQDEIEVKKNILKSLDKQ